MRAVLICLLLVTIETSCSAQGIGKYKYDSAASFRYNSEYVRQHPNDETFLEAYLNLANCYLKLKDSTRYKAMLKNILSDKFAVAKKKCFKNSDYWYIFRSAALELDDQYENEKKYDSALYYLQVSDTLPQVIDCANAIPWQQVKYSYHVASLYHKMNNDRAAVQALIKEGFNIENRTLATELNPFLAAYDKKELKSVLDSAIQNFVTETRTSHSGETLYFFYANFMGVRIYNRYSRYFIPSPTLSESANRAKVINDMKETYLYRIVKGL